MAGVRGASKLLIVLAFAEVAEEESST